jgi:hypothetical protein
LTTGGGIDRSLRVLLDWSKALDGGGCGRWTGVSAHQHHMAGRSALRR